MDTISQSISFLPNFILSSLIIILFGCNQSNSSKPSKIEIKNPKSIDFVTNSYRESFKNSKIKYSYNEEDQTHDYSGNWDFDGDGKKDSIRFEGDNGSHLHFYLVVSLSSKSSAQYFDWIYTDDPFLQPVDSLPEKSTGYLGVNFVVHDFNDDLIDDIFINVGDYGQGLPLKFEELDFKDSKIVLTFGKKASSFNVSEWKIKKNS